MAIFIRPSIPKYYENKRYETEKEVFDRPSKWWWSYRSIK